MRIDVVMPQMGESIAEGTITRWIKSVGQRVSRDEPLFEISTDKVDAEIPAPADGVLIEIGRQAGETVPVNEVVAAIETEAQAGAAAPSKAAPAPVTQDEPAAPKGQAAAPAAEAQAAPRGEDEAFLSPVVRSMVAEHGIDPRQIAGTGAGGRVTKKDVQAFLEQRGAQAPAKAAAQAAAPAPTPAAAPAPRASTGSAPAAAPRWVEGERTARERMSVMRKKIAEHMIASRRTSAHVNSVFEADLTHIEKLRSAHKAAFRERHGANLTYLPFVLHAVAGALEAWPVVNASVDGEEIVYHREVNIGIAVALDWGLIVPVIRNANELSIAGLARRVQDLATRARGKQLNPDEVAGGTFTVTNPGQFGGLYGLPIINQPQVAILGIGGVKKRAMVIDDAIAIRSMVYLSMSYDHRIVDGAVADQFLAHVQRSLERFDETLL